MFRLLVGGRESDNGWKGGGSERKDGGCCLVHLVGVRLFKLLHLLRRRSDSMSFTSSQHFQLSFAHLICLRNLSNAPPPLGLGLTLPPPMW